MGVLPKGLKDCSHGFVSPAGPHGLSLTELHHDLRQPLTSVKLLVDTMLSTASVPPDAVAMLDCVQQQTEWMLQLLGSDLDQQPEVSIVDLADIAQSSCVATPTGVPYRERVHAEHGVSVLADPVGLKRVVWNLLDNARRAVAQGGEVQVRVRARGRDALLEVGDSGAGFGRVPTHHGLGLIGVRRFAERFGGDFSVGTSSLGGALVTLRLPMVPGGDVHCGPCDLRIVVCDDHRVLLDALSHALATEGFTVEAATSTPAEAVAAVRLYDPDLLLVDVSFPAANGLEAAREVVSDHPRTRVVILTGSDDSATAMEAARIGVAGYLRKDQRVPAIAEALRRAAAGEPWVDTTTVSKRLRPPQSNGASLRSLDDLTRQERVVLALLEEGLSTAEIVRELGIGNSTVRSHVQAILTKLGVHSRLQAVAMVSHESSCPQVKNEDRAAVPSRAEPVRIALMHPQGAWVDALESLLLERDDVDVVMAHTNPDWIRGSLESEVEVLVVALGEAEGFQPQDIVKLRRQWPGIEVVVVSDSSDIEAFVATFRAGARAWVPGSTSVDELMRVVHGVARGETSVPPDLLTVLLQQLLTSEGAKERAQDALSVLSTREKEILACLAQGMTRAQIVERFTLSPNTVRTHIGHVLTKLDVHNTLSAVSIARKAGLAAGRPDEGEESTAARQAPHR